MSCLSSLLLSFSHRAATEIYTLSLHDALPILALLPFSVAVAVSFALMYGMANGLLTIARGTVPLALVKRPRSEEHTSELQSHSELVCRLLLEKKDSL